MTFKELLNKVRFDDVAHKLSLRFVSKREAFCMETESVLYQNVGRFVWKRKVGIGFSPLFCSHPKHCHIQHVSLLGIDDTCLCRGDFFGNQMAFDGIRMNAVVNLIVFSTHSLTLITKLGKPACILKWSNSTTLKLVYLSISAMSLQSKMI